MMGSSSTSHRRPNRRNASNQPSHWKSEQIATIPPPAMVRVASSIGGTKSVPLPSPGKTARHGPSEANDQGHSAEESGCALCHRRSPNQLDHRHGWPRQPRPRPHARQFESWLRHPQRKIGSRCHPEGPESRSSRSSWKTLTWGSPARAVTFQSINRTSSPGV